MYASRTYLNAIAGRRTLNSYLLFILFSLLLKNGHKELLLYDRFALPRAIFYLGGRNVFRVFINSRTFFSFLDFAVISVPRFETLAI